VTIVARPGEVLLNPGEFYFADGDLRLHTLLGSCVSITLWHPRLHVGGMCHYMLPSRGSRTDADELDGRYADEAMRMFLGELALRGTRPEEYEARMFGGGNQFAETEAAVLDIPQANIVAGLRLLDRYGFVLTTTHLGGTGSRRLVFDLATGAVRLKHMDQYSVGSAA
jgi:chemotaxis protein CheD